MENTDNIQTMGREELIKAVIEKHERLIAEYTEEFTKIGETIDTRNSEIGSLKKDLGKDAKDVTPKEVSDEKMHLYADKVVSELGAIRESLGNIRQADVDNAKRDIDSIIEKIRAFVSAKNMEASGDKKELYDAISADIKGLVIDHGKAEALQADLDQAYEAYRKLYEIIEAENLRKAQKTESAADRPAGDAKNDAKRYEWLGRRILSHTEALEYWKGVA